MPVSEEARKDFNESIRPIKEQINGLIKKDKDESFALRNQKEGVELKKIALAEQMIYLATVQMSINNISVEMLEVKNNDILNDARKSLYKAIIYLEDVVSNTVDCPYSDIESKILPIKEVSITRRLDIIRKLGLALDLLVDAFGENSKWKESFVEMRGRHAVVAKNLVDMKQAVKDYFDHNSPVYEDTILYVRLIRELLSKCANDYRDRYELASKRVDDMRMAVNLLIALRRIAMVMNDSEESENIRKKALAWKTKMESDEKKGISK
ncbi:hypothetical protein [Treponema sp.]|uniref:hypothetical protein n=1 Tax=Treponema sp. TaxID=166 RepID=UPI001DF11E8B|nr:hypothetical protein [Treponema sp.]MBS7240973.1 hypothetical protein [Treponema sp.]MDY4132412.1 hypothetical protein [Treponema sp.]